MSSASGGFAPYPHQRIRDFCDDALYKSTFTITITITGELSLDPAGGLPSFRPLIAHPWKKSCGCLDSNNLPTPLPVFVGGQIEIWHNFGI